MGRTFLAILLMAGPAPALACLPPPPGVVEPPLPTVKQRAEAIARGSENIVYGVLARGLSNGKQGKLRILHVYKGSLRVGAGVAIKASWGFDPPMCAGMFGGPPPTPRGTYGVFAWSGEPELNAVSDEQLAAMFELGVIARANGR
jgi:hypothetical protein